MCFICETVIEPWTLSPTVEALIAWSLRQPKVPPLFHSVVGDIAAIQTAIFIFA